MTRVPDPGVVAGPAPGRPPRALDVVLAGVLLEAVALGAGVVWAAADLARGRSGSPGASIVLAALLAGLAAAVVAAARALRRGARRARGLVVTWQLLQAASGMTLLGVADPPRALPWVAGAAIVLAAVVVTAALSPSAVRFTAAHDDADGDGGPDQD